MASQDLHEPHRLALRDAIATIDPLDERERHDLHDALAWLDSGAPLWRTAAPATPPKHLVAYTAVIDPSGTSVYLLHHRKALMWLPPGGHVEPGETTLTAAEREVHEELGQPLRSLCEQPLMLSVDRTVGVGTPHVDVSLWHVFVCPNGLPLTPDPAECFEARWFHADELPGLPTTPHIERFLRKLPRMS